ncbi:creatininase family protein, partial [Candidatus Poribacteria bacterium]|nr:creatininase family protein [Candidatus Poribacteria bacterium]
MSEWEIPLGQGHMDKASGVYLQNMTMHAIKERLKKNDIIIVPVGSTENHGANAPLGEDTFLVTKMAEAIALKTGCTVTQPIWYGSHPYHHMGMPGTIIVDEEIFTGLLRAVMAGLWNMGFRKQILLNGHGQEYVIPVAIHQFAKRYQVPGVFVNLNWYHAVPEYCKTRDKGGPYETPFIHADEAETSWALAILPEFMDMERAVDTKPRGYLSEGHIDKAGNIYNRPIKWYAHVGLGPIEVTAYPEGVVGKTTLADASKAQAGVGALLDYILKLHNDIRSKFPPGKLPLIEEMTQKSREEIEAVIKGPLAKGGRSIYTIM